MACAAATAATAALAETAAPIPTAKKSAGAAAAVVVAVVRAALAAAVAPEVPRWESRIPEALSRPVPMPFSVAPQVKEASAVESLLAETPDRVAPTARTAVFLGRAERREPLGRQVVTARPAQPKISGPSKTQPCAFQTHASIRRS